MLFHVKPYKKALYLKGFFLFLLFSLLLVSCSAPRQAVDVTDYVLMDNGKPILGNNGLTAFIFENDPRKIPFNEFISDRFNLGTYEDLEYWVTLDEQQFKVIVYEDAELQKYFDTSAFIASNVQPEGTVIGSDVEFLALSVISDKNEDCLSAGSLYRNTIIKYLLNLKKEYYNH